MQLGTDVRQRGDAALGGEGGLPVRGRDALVLGGARRDAARLRAVRPHAHRPRTRRRDDDDDRDGERGRHGPEQADDQVAGGARGRARAGARAQPAGDPARARPVRAALGPRGRRLPAAAAARGAAEAAPRPRGARRSTGCRRSTRAARPSRGSRPRRPGCWPPPANEAEQLTDEYISTEHLLLAMLGDAGAAAPGDSWRTRG